MMEQNVQTLITWTHGAHPAWLQYHGPAHDAREYQRRGGTQLHILPPPPPPPLTDPLLPSPPPPPPELLHPHFMPTLRRSPSTLGGSCPADASSYRTRKSRARPRHLRHSRSASSTRRTKHASKRARALRSITASSAPRYSRRPFTRNSPYSLPKDCPELHVPGLCDGSTTATQSSSMARCAYLRVYDTSLDFLSADAGLIDNVSDPRP